MLTFKHKIQDKFGFHARPIGHLVKLVHDVPCEVTVETCMKKANAKSIFSLMHLAAKQGQILTVTCKGEQEMQTHNLLLEFFSKNI